MKKTIWILAAVVGAACGGDDTGPGANGAVGGEDGGGTPATCPATALSPDDCTDCMEAYCCDELVACTAGSECASCIADVASPLCTDAGYNDVVRFGACGIANCDAVCTNGAAAGGGGGSGAAGGTSGVPGTGGVGGAGTGGVPATGGAPQTGGTGGLPPIACDPVQLHEPNETPDQAAYLGIASDCDNVGTTISTVLNVDGDEDWFSYSGSDDFGCVLSPSVSLSNAPPGLQLCVYPDCGPDGTTVTCTTGYDDFDLSISLAGCCSNGGSVEFGVNCAGTSDSADVLVHVSDPTSDLCSPYDMTYGY